MNKEFFMPVNTYQTPVDASQRERYPEEVVDNIELPQ
jgi:hypothetical protein